MIRIENITDMRLVRETMTVPHIWDAMTDDGDGDAASFAPVASDTTWWLGAWDGEEFLGMFVIRYLNAVCCESHIAMLPNCGGFRAIRAFQAGKAWVWANTAFRRIITATPSCNAKAVKFVRLAGFVRFGVNEGAWLKNGILYDLLMSGVNHGR